MKCICVLTVVVPFTLSQNFVAIVYQRTEHVCTPYRKNKQRFTEAERLIVIDVCNNLLIDFMETMWVFIYPVHFFAG